MRVLPRHPLLVAPKRWRGWLALALGCFGGMSPAPAQMRALPPAPTPALVQNQRGFFAIRQPQRRVVDMIPRQEGPKLTARLMDQATPDKTNVVVSISKQRVYLLAENEIVIDSPISTGRKGHPTPTGSFRVTVKEVNHYSNIYGNYVDRDGRVVRSGISAQIDSAPSGTHFQGAPMKYFMRLTDGGVGMHIGILPGYAASHGCIRLPAEIAPLIYARVKVGTPVRIEE